jgi:hypothetical protein
LTFNLIGGNIDASKQPQPAVGEMEMQTFAKRNEEKGRTVPITVEGTTRWIATAQKIAIEHEWRHAGTARYAPMLGDTQASNHDRVFDLFESPKYDYVIRTTDPAFDGLALVASVLALPELMKQYNADPRWIRLED